MACTPAAVISYLAALVLAAACGGGGGSPDAAAPDAPAPADAREPADARPDADLPDAMIPPQGAVCTDPIPLAPGASASGDTTGMKAIATGQCSIGSGSAKDTKYLVDLGDTAQDLVVQLDVDEGADPPFDAVLY